MSSNTVAQVDNRPKEYHVASFVAQAIASQLSEVEQAITASKGSEIHAVTLEGKIVFTLEACTQQAIGKLIDKLKYHTGLLSLAPVYHQYLNENNEDD